RPDIALRRILGDRPVRDPIPVRRPARLDGVAGEELPLLTAGDLDGPELRQSGPAERILDRLRSDDDPFSIRRPGGVVADVGQPADRLASRAHDEDAAAAAVRP